MNNYRRGTNQYAHFHKGPSAGTVKSIVWMWLIMPWAVIGFMIANPKLETFSPLASEGFVQKVSAAAIDKADRVSAVAQLLKQYNSPMVGNAHDFIRVADDNALDWTIMVSISGKESTFGKFLANSYNPFGLTTGLKTGPRFRSFSSFKEAIEAEGELLSNHYRLNANKAIGYKYCPIEECSATWAEDVTGFSKQLIGLAK